MSPGSADRARRGSVAIGGLRKVTAGTRASELFARRHALLAALIYLIAAAIMQQHALAHLSTVIAGNLIADPTQYMWTMWWWPHAILHGENPFVTHEIWVPVAYNLGSVTSTPLPALVCAPLTAILGPVRGPVVDYNLLSLVAPVLSGWFVYRLCLYVTAAPGASIVGGWLFGFSTYGLSQLQGHLNLFFTFLPPVLLLLSLQRLNAVMSRRRYIGLAAAALAAQILIGTEIVFTTTCMGVIIAGAALSVCPRAKRKQILRLVSELFCAYGLAALVCSPFLFYALTGPEVEANYNSVLKVADLLSFAIPTRLTWLGGYRFSTVSAGFPPASHLETGTYLGLPVIAAALAFWARSWRNWPTKVLVIATAVAAIWSLGPSLIIDGHSTIWLPWKLLEYKHPFNEVTPVRIGMFVALGTAIAFAQWMASGRRGSRWRWIVALLAIVFLLPSVNGTYSWGAKIYREDLHSPSFITSGAYRRYLRRGEVILPVPFGPFGNSLLWQAQARGYFRLASGWFGYWPPGYATNMVISQLSRFHPFTDPVFQVREFLLAHRVGAVVMLPGQSGPWPHVMAQLRVHRISVGGVWLYQVPFNVIAPVLQRDRISQG